MRRYYIACYTCRRRTRLISKSSETFGSPPISVERYYHCPNCGAEWTHDVERNFLRLGVPTHLTRPGR